MSKCPHGVRAGENEIASRLLGTTRIVVKTFIGRIIIVVHRQMSGTLRERHIQTAAGVHLSKQDFGNSTSLLFTTVPLHDYSFTVVFHPRHGERLAGHKHHHGRLAGSFHGSNQFFLTTRQANIGKIEAFTAHRVGPRTTGRTAHGTYKKQCHITVTGRSHSLSESATVLSMNLTTLSIIDFHFTLGNRFDTLQWSNTKLIAVRPHIIAKLHLGRIGTDYGNRTKLVHIERQQILFVFHQDGRFASGFQS